MDSERKSEGRAVGVLQLGLAFVANVLVFAWLGRIADTRLGTSGLITAISIILGLCTSFVVSGIAFSRLWRRTGR